jgi:hypothetical protein
MHPPSGSFSSRLIACIILVLGIPALQAAPLVNNITARAQCLASFSIFESTSFPSPHSFYPQGVKTYAATGL